MVGLEKPERIRILNETNEGTVVTADLTGCQPESKFTLDAALGIAASSSYLLAPRNLVVEGESSGAILAELSNLFIRSGLAGLPDDVSNALSQTPACCSSPGWWPIRSVPA